MKKRLLVIVSVALLLAGCTELTQILQTVSEATTNSSALTEREVISGLKEALTIGARNSAGILSKENGYYGDELVKILLPEQAQVVVNNISRIPGGEELLENVILSINRAAEDAAKEVAPIFVNAITDMTVADAWGVLRGGNSAATNYLKSTTYTKLYDMYKPKIQASISKTFVGDISAASTWNTLTSKWNSVANTMVGRLAGFNPVNVELDEYLTNKALDGMFLKVQDEENKIRTNVSARVTTLLRRVFGSLD